VNEVQPRARERAHPADVARVGRNLGLEEHNVEHAESFVCI
jgi:hypothetical protein